MGYSWDNDRTERIPVVPAEPRQSEARPPRNVAAVVSIACAVVGLLIVPVLLGPAAIIAGAVGATVARNRDIGGAKGSLLAILIGLLEVVHIITA